MALLRRWILLSLLALLLAPMALASGSSPAPTRQTPAPATPKTPEQFAVEHYNAGISRRNRAWKLEEKLLAAPDAKKAKLGEKVKKQYLSAIQDFRNAIGKSPRMHQAYSGLGYALRKTGQYEGSLEAYDQALHLEPAYTEAIEYRAEAYLGLNRIEDAKKAYMELFRMDRENADTLLAAMKEWIAKREAKPEGLPTDSVKNFAGWVAGRDELARQTASLSMQQKRRW